MANKVTNNEIKDILDMNKSGSTAKEIAIAKNRALSTINRVLRIQESQTSIASISMLMDKDLKMLTKGLVSLRKAIFIEPMNIWSETLITLINKAEDVDRRMKF